jgi:hypothetical protein
MKRQVLMPGALPLCLLLAACASPPLSIGSGDCSTFSATSLNQYDEMSKQYLDDRTSHPPSNYAGGVVWNARYYLESLVTAYSATHNPKYIQAFLGSGTWVLNMTQTMTFVDGKDATAPGKLSADPPISRTGWPTYMATFGVPVSIPTAMGQDALYVQSLYPTSSIGASFLDVTQNSDGSLQVSWSRAGANLPSYRVRTVDDLNAIVSEPLVYGQSPGRMAASGLGLPFIGHWEIDHPLLTIWHGEQTGGMLLPFVQFLLLARDEKGLVNPRTVSAWTSKIKAIADDYKDEEFVSDGAGGLLIRNPGWMTSTDSGLYAEADYAYVEATMRLLLYELAGDPHDLAIAKGLVAHQKTYHWQLSAQGWLLLKEWPCVHPWSRRSEAPAGSIWSSLSQDPTTPESASAGMFFGDLLHFAQQYNLSAELGLTDAVYAGHRNTFQEYLRVRDPVDSRGEILMRNHYPAISSTRFDPVDSPDVVLVAAGFLQPEVADSTFITTNWHWMLSHAKTPQAEPVGYFLRAWARSEAAALASCKLAPK